MSIDLVSAGVLILQLLVILYSWRVFNEERTRTQKLLVALTAEVIALKNPWVAQQAQVVVSRMDPTTTASMGETEQPFEDDRLG